MQTPRGRCEKLQSVDPARRGRSIPHTFSKAPCSGMRTSRGRLCTILVGVVSVSALGGKNEWVSTARDTISVRCPDLGGVRFSEVANVLVLR